MAESAATRVPTPELLDAVRAVLDGHASTEARDAAALWLIQAELLGLPKFGIGMLLRDLGQVDSRVSTEVDTDRARPAGAVDMVDAAGAPGIVALASATALAAEAAAAHGAGIIAVRNLGATGIIGCAARSLAVEGRIGIVVAESAPFVAPYGGVSPAIGTNPFAIAVPREGQSPLVLDFATAPITIAELRGRAERGESLEAGIALDRTGAPTIDPAEVAALLPAGRTASLLGLVVQLLAGVAVGGASTDERDGLFAPRGAMVIAFDPPNADTARACLALVERWSQAGGHVPGRLDRLPTRLSELPAELEIDAATLDRLRDASRAF